MNIPPTTTIATANPTADARNDFVIFLLWRQKQSSDFWAEKLIFVIRTLRLASRDMPRPREQERQGGMHSAAGHNSKPPMHSTTPR